MGMALFDQADQPQMDLAGKSPAIKPETPAPAPSQARVEDTGTGKSVAIIGASEAQLAAVAAAIPNAKPVKRKDGATVYSKKYADRIRDVLAGDANPVTPAERAAVADKGDEWRRPDGTDTALDYDSTERDERVRIMEAAGVNSVMLAGGPKRNSATPFDELPEKVKRLVHTYLTDGKRTAENGPIGQNSRGQDVFEDENGVRSVVERGIRLTEPVEMRPTRDRGYVPSVDVTNREDRFKTAAEMSQSKPDQKSDLIEAAKASGRLEIVDTRTPAKKAWRNPEAFIRIAADDVSALRKVDVERVIREAPAESRGNLADYISSNRSDLAEEVRDVMDELSEDTRPSEAELSRQSWQSDFDAAGKRMRERLDAIDPNRLRPLLEAMAEGRPIVRDGDVIETTNPHRAYELGYIEMDVSADGVRSFKITDTGRAFLAGEPVSNADEFARGDRIAFDTPKDGAQTGKIARVNRAADGRTYYDVDVDGGGLQQVFADEARAAPAEVAAPSNYGANNRLVTQERAEELRKRLKDKLNRLNAGIDPEILAIGTELAVFHIEAGARRFRDLARAIAADLDQPVADLRRYLRGWYNGARDMMEDSGESVAGMDDADEVGRAMRLFAEWSDEPAAPAAAPTVSPELAEASADVLVDYFVNGGRFGSITEARAFLADLTGEKVKPGTAEAKRADETIEGAVVQAARKIASKGQSPLATYRELVDLYQRQPNLAVRSSTSVEQQAYSTPVPLAYLASQRAGINQNTTVYEPSAGNGALLIDARATYVTANELNPDRAAQLRSIYRGAQITEKDATTFVPPGGQRDVVIANPPFGVVRDATGEPLSFEMGDGYVTREIDHAISLMALDSMKNGGKAVLIVGGINKKITDPDKRADAYNGKAKREFYYRLYSEYNVTDHFTVAGELYAKQGAGWPVDVIVIEGRGKSKLKLPAVEAPRQYATWAEMEEALERGPGLHSETSPEAGDVDRTGREPVRSDGRDRGGRSAGRIDRQPERPAAGQPDRIRDGSPDREPNGGRLDDRAPSVRDRTDAGSAAVAGNRTARREPSLNRAPVAGENAHQVTYQSASGAKSLDTLVPVNMQTAVSKALDKLQDRVGGVDGFVADRLGYEVEKIADYFSAEQVDALALALDNMERGAGFIIGDQTGIGKGRVVAGVIRYALRSGRMPIFVTEKPNLYADMYRDMNDVGIPEMLGRPVGILMTNASETVPLDEEGNDVLKTPAAGKHNARLQEVADGDRDGVDVIFTTYAQMQPIKGQWTPRQQVISAMAPGSIIVFDESHNAGGQGKQEDRDKKKDDGAPNRAEFARLIAGQAHGVFFSSATYAKRPEVMDLYASTDMRLAVANIDKLAEAISKGGIPMQQVVASTLTEAGQYVRRERSFDGVEYRTPQVAVDRDAYSLFTQVLAGIQDFQEDYISEAVKIMDKEVREDAKSISFDGSVGRAGASSTNFTSVMHNIVEQMLLAMKAPAAADLAIAALEQGKKPVITAANTMGSFIEQYAEENGIGNGQPMPSDFRDVLLRYLDRTRQITVRRPFSKEKGEKVYIADHQLGAGGLAAFNAVKARIEAMDLGSVPISPFDYIRDRLAKAGYRVAEITGRSATLDYSGDTPRFRIRPGKEKSIQGRRDAITGFNSGQIDAMLLNQAGSTGLSLHASEKFEDQRPRLMIIAQAERNIDTHMQMLGRIHRTGQVVLPEYDQLVAAVPAEMRPAAVLAKKMASLNANTTGARGSAMTAEDVPDFMNEYGDEIAARLMEEDDTLHRRLAEPLKESDGKEDGLKREDAARRVTGRLMLLPLDEQEAFYERFISEYQDYLAQKEAAGEASLEAKTLDLDARTVAKQQIIGPSNENSPFGAGVDLEVLDVKRLGKPMSPDEILDSIAVTLGVDRPDMNSANSLASLREQGTRWAKDFRKPFEDDFFHYRRDVLDNLDEAKVKATAERIESGRQQFMELAGLLYPGATIALESSTGETIHGVVLSVDKNSKSKNPLALSTFRATFAMAEATGRMTIPFSQLRGSNGGDRPGTRLVRPVTAINGTPVLTFFGESQTEGREKRAFLTGNILAAFEHTNGKGQIVNFVREDGSIASGLMMKRGYDHGKETARQPVTFRTPEQVLSWLDQGLIAYGDGVIVERDGDRLHVTTAASKAAGGRYFLNQRVRDALGGDFYKKSTGMVADGSYANAREIVKALQDVGARFAAKDNLDQARKIVAGEVREPKMSLPRDADLPLVATLTGKEVATAPDLMGRRAQVAAWFKRTLRPKVVTASDGVKVRFGRQTTSKLGSAGDQILAAFPAVEKIITDGVYLGETAASPKWAERGVVKAHEYAARVSVGGVEGDYGVIVHELADGRRFYYINDMPIPNEDVGGQSSPTEGSGKQSVPREVTPDAGINLFRLPETSKGDADTSAQNDAGLARLQDELSKLGLANKVAVRLLDTMGGANGSYVASLITVARDGDDTPIFTLHHEAVHALRDMGVFSPADWALLVAKAKRTPGMMRQINRRYLPMFKRMKMTAAEIEDAINEEAVADMFAMWQRGDYQAKGTIERLFQRLRGILDAVKRAFGQQRERTGDDVLGEIADGTMGARAQAFTSGGARGQVRPTFGRKMSEARDDMVELGATDDTTRGKMAAAFDKWRTAVQDRYLPLLKVQREIEQQTGQALPNHLNPYLGEELMTGRIGAQLEKLSEDMVAPLFDAMAEEGINTAELESYLYARHAPERNARIAEINPDFAEGEGSGMTDLEARAIMNRIDREGKTEAMERLARRIDAIRDFSVDYRVESGLMSEEQAAEWRDTYEYYVPLRGFAETDGDPAAADKINRSGGGINVRGKESKAAYGRRSKADSPLAYLILQAEESIVRGETNRVAQRFVKLAQENPSDGFWKVQKSTAKRRINEDTGLVEEYLTHNLTAEDKDWTVSAKFDGKERRVTMDRTNPAARRLADAMRNLTQQQMDWVTLHLGKVNRFLSAVNTSYNPEFVITNAFRDLQTATINMAGLDVKGLTAGTLRDYPAALKAATKGSFGKGDGPWRDHWDAFIEAGGRVSFNQVEDVAEIKKRIEKSFAMAAAKRGDGDARLHVKRTFMAAKDLIENLNSGVENAVRLSAFKNARERGVPIEQAASIAKNLTVNFNRRGTAGPALNAAYLFFNASVQGSTRIFQAMRSPKVRKILAGVVVLGFALEMLNAMTAGDDDDEENFYDKVPDYEKERNLIVMLPGGEYVKIPLPYGYNAFFGTGRSIAEIMRRGGDRWQETMGNWAGMVVDAFNPVGGTNSLLNFISPTIIDPVVDLTLNRDFADKPIMPDQPAYDSPMPDNQRYWGSVAPHWRAVTDFLNEATGGDKVVPGAIDVSPATLEYLSGVVVGAAGAFADRVAGMLSKGLDPNATLEANDLILTRKVVGEKASWYDKSAYYDRMETFDLHFDRTKDYLDAEMIDEARAYANDHVAILSLELEAKAARKAMKDVRKERKGLNHAHDLGKLTDDQYQRGMEIVKTQEDAVVKGFNTAWNRAMKQGE